VGAVTAPTAAVVRELIAAGMLTIDDAVEHGVTVTDASVSHRSSHVRVGAGGGLFVKRADRMRSQGRDLGVEAAVYRLAAGSQPLAEVIPRCHMIAADDSMVVLEAVPGAPLSEAALLDPEQRSVLCRYGRAVARVHALRPPPIGQPPWLLGALEPGWGGYDWLPVPCRSLLLRLAATPQLRDGFRRAAAAWRPVALVHGDLRCANVLTALDGDAPRVWLVDWELACLGDPAWDVASLLADMLAAAARRGLESGALPDVWEPAHAWLGGYRARAAAPDGAWLELVRRAVALTGVRLVQTLLEYGHYGADQLAAMEPALLPWASELLGAPPQIVATLAQGAHRCSCKD
jgi:Ser/Thr protein kinase RdoA (MazF antagonist)